MLLFFLCLLFVFDWFELLFVIFSEMLVLLNCVSLSYSSFVVSVVC